MCGKWDTTPLKPKCNRLTVLHLPLSLELRESFCYCICTTSPNVYSASAEAQNRRALETETGAIYLACSYVKSNWKSTLVQVVKQLRYFHYPERNMKIAQMHFLFICLLSPRENKGLRRSSFYITKRESWRNLRCTLAPHFSSFSVTSTLRASCGRDITWQKSRKEAIRDNLLFSVIHHEAAAVGKKESMSSSPTKKHPIHEKLCKRKFFV